MDEEAEKVDTLPKLLSSNYRKWGDARVALRKKEYGIWREYTWKDCSEKTKAIFLGLTSIGLEAGDGVYILADSNPEWFWSELAVQTAGGVVIGLDAAATTEETRRLMNLTSGKIALVQDQEQVDKLLDIGGGLAALKRIVYWNDRGLRHYADTRLMSLAELVEVGNPHERSHPGAFERALGDGLDTDMALMLSALGDNSHISLVPVTHAFLLSSASSTLGPTSSANRNRDEYMSMINPGSFLEQTLGFATCMLKGQILNFVERPETAQEDIRAVSPHIVVDLSRAWEDLASTIQDRVRSGSWLKKALFNWSLSIGYRRSAESPPKAGPASVLTRCLWEIASILVIRPLRDKHGLGRARILYMAGGTITAKTKRFFRAIGLNPKEVFGSAREGVVSDPPEGGVQLK